MARMCSSAEKLPEELLLEILARVPYRSLCRFRCVSPSWRALCSDAGLLKRSPKTLSGFFCYTLSCRIWIYFRDTRFLNFPGGSSGRRPLIDPSLAFLRAGGYTGGFVVADCCGGLLLVCEGPTSAPPAFPLDRDYLVCNSATEKWTVLPRIKGLQPQKNILRLCVDPADPSRFTVFLFVHRGDECRIIGVKVYSSETRTWTSGLGQIGWGEGTSVRDYDDTSSVSVFLNGTLHLLTHDSHVVTVDMDCKTWRKFPTPYRRDGYIGLSRGRLHAMEIDHCDDNGCLLSVWVLEDYAACAGSWTLKHTANITELLGMPPVQRSKLDYEYTLIAIHPDCDLILFIDGLKRRIMAYDMDSQEVQVVYNYNEAEYYNGPYLPYTPCFADWLHPIQRKEMVLSSGRKKENLPRGSKRKDR